MNDMLIDRNPPKYNYTKAKTIDQVYRVFMCICGELKVCGVRALVSGSVADLEI